MDDDVALLAADDLIAPAGVGHNGNLVAHGAGGNKHRCLLAHQLGGHLFQLSHGGVVPVYIVAHNGGVHGIAHFLGGLGDCIAANINITHGKTHSFIISVQTDIKNGRRAKARRPFAVDPVILLVRISETAQGYAL